MSKTKTSNAVAYEKFNEHFMHSVNCRDANCHSVTCSRFKSLFRHVKTCPNRHESIACSGCRTGTRIMRKHAYGCTDDFCSLIWCDNLKRSKKSSEDTDYGNIFEKIKSKEGIFAGNYCASRLTPAPPSVKLPIDNNNNNSVVQQASFRESRDVIDSASSSALLYRPPRFYTLKESGPTICTQNLSNVHCEGRTLRDRRPSLNSDEANFSRNSATTFSTTMTSNNSVNNFTTAPSGGFHENPVNGHDFNLSLNRQYFNSVDFGNRAATASSTTDKTFAPASPPVDDVRNIFDVANRYLDSSRASVITTTSSDSSNKFHAASTSTAAHENHGTTTSHDSIYSHNRQAYPYLLPNPLTMSMSHGMQFGPPPPFFNSRLLTVDKNDAQTDVKPTYSVPQNMDVAPPLLPFYQNNSPDADIKPTFAVVPQFLDAPAPCFQRFYQPPPVTPSSNFSYPTFAETAQKKEEISQKQELPPKKRKSLFASPDFNEFYFDFIAELNDREFGNGSAKRGKIGAGVLDLSVPSSSGSSSSSSCSASNINNNAENIFPISTTTSSMNNSLVTMSAPLMVNDSPTGVLSVFEKFDVERMYNTVKIENIVSSSSSLHKDNNPVDDDVIEIIAEVRNVEVVAEKANGDSELMPKIKRVRRSYTRQTKAVVDAAEEDFTCCVCLKAFDCPVLCLDCKKITGCKTCIDGWGKHCPTCRGTTGTMVVRGLDKLSAKLREYDDCVSLVSP